MNNKYQATFDALLIAVIAAVLFGLFLGSYHLITPDEGRYVEVAREMAFSGNYITPHLNGIVFLDKPILYYWFQAAMINLFGLHEWSVRILPAFFGVLGCVVTYLAGRQLYSRKAGYISALILMSTGLYFFSSHYADMDLMVSVLISVSLFLFIMGIELPRGRRADIHLWLAYAFAALAVLTKGLMGIVFPLMIIGAWILLFNQWRVIARMRLFSGLIIFLVISVPWFVAVQLQNPEFLNYFFVVQQFSRFLTKHFNMHQPFYFYFVTVLLGFIPWIVFLFQALISAAKRVWREKRAARVDAFLLLWPLLIFVFFSIPQSKIIGYIIPIFPPLALLVGVYLTQQWEMLQGSKNLKRSVSALLFLMGVLLIGLVVVACLPMLSTPKSWAYLAIVAVLLLVGALIITYNTFMGRRFAAVFFPVFFTFAFVSVAGVASLHTYKLDSVKPLAKIINQQIKPGDKVVTFFKYYYDLPIYTKQRIYVVTRWDKKSVMSEDNWRRELAEGIIYKHKRQPWLVSINDFGSLWHEKHRVFLLTDKGWLPHFKGWMKGLHSKWYLLGTLNEGKSMVYLISNQKS